MQLSEETKVCSPKSARDSAWHCCRSVSERSLTSPALLFISGLLLQHCVVVANCSVAIFLWSSTLVYTLSGWDMNWVLTDSGYTQSEPRPSLIRYGFVLKPSSMLACWLLLLDSSLLLHRSAPSMTLRIPLSRPRVRNGCWWMSGGQMTAFEDGNGRYCSIEAFCKMIRAG